MNTLEMGGTTSPIPGKSVGTDLGTAPGYMASLVEGLVDRAVNTPTKAHKQLAWWVWGTGAPVLVDLEVTGATSIDLDVLPYVTQHHSMLRALPADLEDTFAEIDALKELSAGWNGYDVASPKIEAIQDATEWVTQMYEDVVRSRLAWHKPHVAADENGDVTFEWWSGDKGLTIYVSANDSVSYLKDWGFDMVDDMEDGFVSTSEERREMWAWFVRQ